MAVDTNNKPVTGWIGWIYFAGCMMMISGIFQLIVGFTALLNDKFFAVQGSTLVVFDITTWGWIHILLGLVVLCAGMALLSGSRWARVVAVILAVLNFVAQFAFIGTYPIWSGIIMILDLFVIYALTVHGSEIED